MNLDAFFKNATLAICGDLRIEVAMQDCVNAIRDVVPVDRMFLQIYEPDLGAMRTMADATPNTAKALDLLTPMPEAVRALVIQNLDRLREGAVTIESPEKNPIAKEMLRFHGIEGWSILRMTLSTKNRRLGGVVLTAEGPNRYNEAHIQRLTLLKKPFTVALFNTLEHREVLRLRDRLADDNRYLNRELQRLSGDEIIGADFGLKSVMQLVQQVASTDSPVLLSGETGVGKDVVANVIHGASLRSKGPFIAVNCGAIPATLLDSELFGHEKGAFTGALSQKRGRFERANSGTIFLDEIGEMPLDAQVRLLRVLQNREIERIGGVERIPVDIRIIAATNKNLPKMVQAGSFREDLWFRLNVFPIAIPALRDRTCDIPALVQHFIAQKAKHLKLKKTPILAPGAIETLIAYAWPGNVRELENVVERAMILHRNTPLTFDLMGPGPQSSKPVDYTADDAPFPSLDDVEEKHIRHALERTGGKIHGPNGAGELLGVNPNTLRHRMRKHHIEFKKDIR